MKPSYLSFSEGRRGGCVKRHADWCEERLGLRSIEAHRANGSEVCGGVGKEGED